MMPKWIRNKGNRNRCHDQRKNTNLISRHVVTELLATEQVYVEELRVVIEVNIWRINIGEEKERTYFCQ